MSQRVTSIFKGIALTSALIGMVACGNGSGNGGNNNGGNINAGTGTGNAQTDTQTTTSQTQSNTQTGISQSTAAAGAALKLVSVNTQSIPCVGGGTFISSGDVTNGSPTTFDLVMDFDGCTVFDGSVGVTGNVDITTPAVSYDYQIDGDVGGNGCVVTFNNYAVLIDFPDLINNPQSGTVALNGAVTGECANGSTTCTYDNFSFEIGGIPTGSITCQ